MTSPGRGGNNSCQSTGDERCGTPAYAQTVSKTTLFETDEMLRFLDNCQAREVVSKAVSESSRGLGGDLTWAMGAGIDGSLGAMGSMRRRDFLLTAAGALTLAGC